VKTTFYRELGRSGIQISALGLGCWAMREINGLLER